MLEQLGRRMRVLVHVSAVAPWWRDCQAFMAEESRELAAEYALTAPRSFAAVGAVHLVVFALPAVEAALPGGQAELRCRSPRNDRLRPRRSRSRSVVGGAGFGPW
ncbi:hypothetical protein ACFYOD_03140 [Streptomyces sp. NPDC006703]|uniref:hypothetical protein n=1 Tax=Streptomyces sp. NPDC006703 TaxID=3364759 RepID=UPI0036BFB751